MAETKQEVKHTALPWKKYYDNDTGPNDEGFWGWIQVGPAKISLPRHNLAARAQAEADADLIHRAVNSHALLVEALQRITYALSYRAVGKKDKRKRDNEVQESWEQGVAALQAAKQTC